MCWAVMVHWFRSHSGPKSDIRPVFIAMSAQTREFYPVFDIDLGD